ncbi:AraC family transcriptional regulator [Marinilongibacter aquaticus]|uniref:AraC family transcriptional regulator n=1 Tax=Marinilongibacter aquaticus TaxID=2975157 RepID=UPI0021BDDE55|nr:AraC family transcriptional regulator [Marinilongibacter aquaticus]UBM57189.1 AraC family transcriptional regulator [Marinilongibacter aquaticus]
MKVALEKHIESLNSSIIFRDLIEPYFDPNWHFHPHYQLFTVLEGTGTRFVGDSIEHFGVGDTVFLGPDIPHLWSSDKDYFQANSGLKTQGLVLYFTADFLGESFFQKPEMHAIANLMEKSKRGLKYKGKTKDVLIESLIKMRNLCGFESIIELLQLLHFLSKSHEYEHITSINYLNTFKVSETERMQKVHDYVLQNFKDPIRLGDMAREVNMTEPAFCRYFKKRANKTFSEFVNEIRIGHACKLLKSDELAVSQIAYECGFNTLSNFNAQFKRFTDKTPKEYKQDMLNL